MGQAYEVWEVSGRCNPIPQKVCSLFHSISQAGGIQPCDAERSAGQENEMCPPWFLSYTVLPRRY
jgi:hypothetical protein